MPSNSSRSGRSTNLQEQVDLVGATEVWKVATSFEVSTTSFWVALVQFLFHGLRQGTVVVHLHSQCKITK